MPKCVGGVWAVLACAVLAATQVRPSNATEEEKKLAGTLLELPTDASRRELLQREGVPITRKLIQGLLAAGNGLVREGKYSATVDLYQFSLGLADTIGDKTMQSGCLYALGLIREQQGDYEQAFDLVNRSLAQAREIGMDALGIAERLELLGGLQHSMGDTASAIRNVQEGLDIAESSGQTTKANMFRTRLALIYQQTGDYRLALENYEKTIGLKISREGRVMLLNRIGAVYDAQGNLDLALTYYQKSLQLAEEIGYKGYLVEPLERLGSVHQRLGKNQLAADYLRRALSLSESEGDLDQIARAHLGLASLQRTQGQFEDAQRHLETGVALYHTMHYPAMEAVALSGLAAIDDRRGRYAQEAAHANQALELAHRVADPIALWNTSYAAGHAHLRLGKRVEARAELREAIGAIESLSEQVAAGDQDRERFFEDKLAPYHELVKLSLAEGNTKDALAYAERARARVLLEALRRGRVMPSKSMTAEERVRERSLLDRIAALNRRLQEENSSEKPQDGRVTDFQKRVEALHLEYSAFQSQLYAKHPELRAVRLDEPPATAETIAALLPGKQSAALEYVVLENESLLFVVTKNPPYLRRFSIHLRSEELTAKLRRFYAKLSQRDLDFGTDAQELYRLLVEPAAEVLRNTTTMVIVPDGALWQLPFQALSPAADHYWIEQASIFYAPSLTVLAEMLRRYPASASPRTLMAMGNPATSVTSLPEAEAEVNALREIYGAVNSKIYTREEASEATFKQQAGKYSVLHIAAHGELDDRNPMYSHLLLAPGAGDAAEDGLLEAREMMDLDLKAEVVVLSACETARGRVGGGEGLIGMTWALFIAGSPATVATSWKIDSASATRFTLEFHRRLHSGEAKAAALREASLAVMRIPEYRHPYYWSSFSLFGKGI
jgi:CHAT domain-containing protein/Tfp pilus assembly protein PilF